MNPSYKNVLYMLRESNAIEDVYGKAALANARKAFQYVMMYDSLNIALVKHTHKILMQQTDLEPKYRGVFRPIPVRIGGVVKSDPPLVIESKLRFLLTMMNKAEDDKTELPNHLQFEVIHPFVDGNGRIGRILMNWQALKKGNGKLIVVEKSKVMDYYKLFRNLK